MKTNLKGYLYKAARNCILNHIRNKKVKHDFIDLIAAEMEESENATLDAINEKELVALIDQEIALLPPKMKLAFEMSRKEFLSNKQIAFELGISEDAVKQQISRSMKILKLKLGNYSSLSVVLVTLMHQRLWYRRGVSKVFHARYVFVLSIISSSNCLIGKSKYLIFPLSCFYSFQVRSHLFPDH